MNFGAGIPIHNLDVLTADPVSRENNDEKIVAKLDSGCGDHVLPSQSLPQIEAVKGKEANTSYRTASGKVLANGGTKRVRAKAENGTKLHIEWQSVPGLTHPLMSIGKLATSGHRVTFDDDLPGGVEILHKASGRQIGRGRKHHNTYHLELKVSDRSPPF